MINPNWAKWIQRAVVKAFATGLAGHTVLSETEDVDTNDLDHWFTVRIDETFTHLQGSEWKVTVVVDILVMSAKKNSIYNGKTLLGLVDAVFADISVKDDSNNHKFCLRLDSDIINTYYGEVEGQANIEQATVEGTLESIILE